MPSQKEAYKELIGNLQKTSRRKKLLLLGPPQTGKSELLKVIAEENGFTYCNFTREHFQVFMQKKWLESLAFNHFENYLRQQFESRIERTTVILDEIDSVLMALTSKDEMKLQLFVTQFLTLDHHTPYILASAIFSESVMRKLLQQYPEQCVHLYFTSEDKKFLQEEFLYNIGIFDFNKITNVRQMIKS